MSYESKYPFITGNLNGSRQEKEKNEEEYRNQINKSKRLLYNLQEERKMLEARRDELKDKAASRIKREEEIKDHLFKTFMNAVWNEYNEIEKNSVMEENMKKKEEAYEHEYLQLIDEIDNLTKKQDWKPSINN